MADQIKTITDKTQYPVIMEKFFSKGNVYLKRKDGDLNIQYLGMSEGDVAFRIPRVKSTPAKVIVFVRIKESTINCNMTYIENNQDTFIFRPESIQILSIRRKEDRSNTGGDGSSKSAIFIENVVSDFIIKNELSMNVRKADEVRDLIHFDLKKQFDNIIIFFINQGGSDPRMKHFIGNIRPIFIPDMNNESDMKSKEQLNHYINNIYANDFKLSRNKDLISEISLPFLIKTLIPFGYIQVNNKTTMSNGHFAAIKRVPVIINEFFKKKGMFIPEKEKFLVSDLSKKGLGIVFKDRRLIRFFKVDSFVCFEMMLPTMKKAVIGAHVRNISFIEVNKVIKVGFEIKNMDAISEVNYDEFIETLEKS